MSHFLCFACNTHLRFSAGRIQKLVWEDSELHRSQYRLILDVASFGTRNLKFGTRNLLDHFSFCLAHKEGMEISERVVLQYKNGPEVLLPSALLVVEDSGQKWVRFKQTNYATCKLVLGHLENFKTTKNPSLANSEQFSALLSLQHKALESDAVEQQEDELFDASASQEAVAEKKPGKKRKISIEKVASQCTVSLNGTPVCLKTPQSWKETDIVVQLDAAQLGAVVDYLSQDASSCLGQKRSYVPSGKYAKGK